MHLILEKTRWTFSQRNARLLHTGFSRHGPPSNSWLHAFCRRSRVPTQSTFRIRRMSKRGRVACVNPKFQVFTSDVENSSPQFCADENYRISSELANTQQSLCSHTSKRRHIARFILQASDLCTPNIMELNTLERPAEYLDGATKARKHTHYVDNDSVSESVASKETAYCREPRRECTR